MAKLNQKEQYIRNALRRGTLATTRKGIMYDLRRSEKGAYVLVSSDKKVRMTTESVTSVRKEAEKIRPIQHWREVVYKPEPEPQAQ